MRSLAGVLRFGISCANVEPHRSRSRTYPWSEIARVMNSSPARLQKRFERALRRAKGLLEP